MATREEITKALDHIQEGLIDLAESTLNKMEAELSRLQAENAELREAVIGLLSFCETVAGSTPTGLDEFHATYTYKDARAVLNRGEG